MKIITYLIIFSSIAFCQNNSNHNTSSKESLIKKIKHSGYRLGVIKYSKIFHDILEHTWDTPSTLVQVDLETESILYHQNKGSKAFTKSMWLFSGFDQELFLPQFNWKMGLFTKNDLEIGIKPHISLTGTTLIISVENTLCSSVLTYPASLSISVKKHEYFLSLLIGFETSN